MSSTSNAKLVYSTASPPLPAAPSLPSRSYVPAEHDLWTPSRLQQAIASVLAGTGSRIENQIVAWLHEFVRRHIGGTVPSGLSGYDEHRAVLEVELHGGINTPSDDEQILAGVNQRYARHLWQRFLRNASSTLLRLDLDALCEDHGAATETKLTHFPQLPRKGTAQAITATTPGPQSKSYLASCPRCALRRSISHGFVTA